MTVKTVIGTTKVGRAKFAAAHQTGILPRITHLAFGNGGHDPATGSRSSSTTTGRLFRDSSRPSGLSPV